MRKRKRPSLQPYICFISPCGGIFGINCGHQEYPFIDGVNFQTYFPYEKDENAARYKEFQRQRQMERDIRKTKNEADMLNAIGDKDGFDKAAVRLKKQQTAYKKYSDDHGLATHSDRIQKYGFDRSLSKKATAAAKRELDKYSRYHYNKDGSIVITDDWKNKNRFTIPKEYKPFAVIETKTSNGSGKEQIDRSFYDENGKLTKQIHSGNHGKPKAHPYGKHGEHRHSYTWIEGQEHPDRITGELSDFDRKENSDIL